MPMMHSVCSGNGLAILSHFLAADGDHVSILPDCEAVEVHLDELLVRKQERDRYELENEFGDPADGAPAEALASSDYRKVWLMASCCSSAGYRPT